MPERNHGGSCPYHIDHENRLTACEADIEDLKQEDSAMREKIGNPAFAVAVISFLGVCVTAGTSFLAVILAPVIRVWLGVQ